MKNTVTNERLVRRNARIAQITMLGGLLVLAVGMYISFRIPEQFGLSLAALMVGFALSQIGIYFSNRWGRRPRPDEVLNQALKGMDSNFTLYHYYKPTQHLLVGPSGLWVLMPYNQRGRITYNEAKKRWHQQGGNAYMKIFAQEGLGRPDLEVIGEMQNVQEYMKKVFPERQDFPIHAVAVFTNPKAVVDIPEDVTAPAYSVPASKLKDFIRKKSKNKPLFSSDLLRIRQEIAPGE